MEELEIPELAYTSLFSMAWLDSINQERSGNGRVTLEHCLLSADDDIFRVHWEDVVHPEFISRPPKASQLVLENGMAEDTKENEVQEDRASVSEHGILIETSMAESAQRQDPCPTVKHLSVLEQDSSGRSSAADDSEGEYVELADLTLPRFSPQKGSLTQSISMNFRNLHKPRTTGPEQPKANALESTLKSGRCPQSVVCSMLIEENLAEPFLHQTPAGMHSRLQEVNECEPTSSKGTALSDCMPEHEPVTECVPEPLDCIDTALCDLKTNNLMHNEHESLNRCLAPEQDCAQPLLDSYTTDLETSVMDEQRIVSRVETDSNLSDYATRQDAIMPALVLGSDSVENSKEVQTEVGVSKIAQTEPEQEDPTDQPASRPAESENRACGCQCSSESSLSSSDTGEGRPGSASPQGQQVDWDIVSAQPAEVHVTAIRPGHERTEACEKKGSENRNKEYVDAEMELPRDQAEGEQVTEMLYVDESQASTGEKELAVNDASTKGVADDVVEEATSPQTDLVNSTPKPGTTVGTPPGQATGGSLCTEERKEMQDRQKKEVRVSEELESMQNKSNGAEDVGIMGCSVFDNDVTMGIKTETAVCQNSEVMPDVPIANDSTHSEQINIHTSDELAEGVNIPLVVEMEEEMNDRQEESVEEQRLQDEPVSSVNNTQLETGDESHHQQQQQQEKGRLHFLIPNLTCRFIWSRCPLSPFCTRFSFFLNKSSCPWEPLHTSFT